MGPARLTTVAVLLAAAAGGLLPTRAASGPASRPAVVDGPPAGVYAVVRVVDGDTLDIGVPLASGELMRQRVRLLDVDTPERGQAGYDQAREDLRRLAGQRVRISYRPDRRQRDTGGRLLCYVADEAGHNVNQELRRLGWPAYKPGD